MKETIEAYMTVSKEGKKWLTFSKECADSTAKQYDGTVVKLTGEMPRPLRKISTEVWIQPMEPIENHGCLLQFRLGIKDWNSEKTNCCTIRARITMQELPDEI